MKTGKRFFIQVIATFIILFVPVFSFAKNYADANWRVYEIKSQLLEQGLYDSANNAFMDLFNTYDYRFAEGISLVTENIFCNLHKTWQKDSISIDFYFRRFARSYSADNLLNFFCKCADSSTIKKLQSQVIIYDSIFYTSVDTVLMNFVSRMHERDQKPRMENDYENMLIADSLNLIELEKLLQQYGTFPGVRKLGVSGMNEMKILIHHESEQILDKWYDVLMQLIIDGEFAPILIADIIDHAIFMNGYPINNKWATKYVKYGTAEFKGICEPVKNIEQTNRWRREIGLPPLEYDIKKRGVKYDEAEYRKYVQIIE
ncbi:MAG: hypothetical protein LBG17_05860 [Bacteroidales bacterium]|jgi:hypothetical protein|nr:hypothetical protein [Bacteroidales bacterium]